MPCCEPSVRRRRCVTLAPPEEGPADDTATFTIATGDGVVRILGNAGAAPNFYPQYFPFLNTVDGEPHPHIEPYTGDVNDKYYGVLRIKRPGRYLVRFDAISKTNSGAYISYVIMNVIRGGGEEFILSKYAPVFTYDSLVILNISVVLRFEAGDGIGIRMRVPPPGQSDIFFDIQNTATMSFARLCD